MSSSIKVKPQRVNVGEPAGGASADRARFLTTRGRDEAAPSAVADNIASNTLHARERIATQMPLSEKIKVAHYVIDGTLPLEKLRQEVSRIYKELKHLVPKISR